MLTKKDFIENVKYFLKSDNKILTINSVNEKDLIKLTLKILTKEVSNPLTIAFISTTEVGFNEVFSNTKVPLKTSVNYNLGHHKISFHLMSNELIKNPPTKIDYTILYAMEDFSEKLLTKYLTAYKNTSKNIVISRGSAPEYKSVNKLIPQKISFEVDKSTNYYSKMKNVINNYK